VLAVSVCSITLRRCRSASICALALARLQRVHRFAKSAEFGRGRLLGRLKGEAQWLVNYTGRVVDVLFLVTLVVLVALVTTAMIREPFPWWWVWPWGRMHWAVWAILAVLFLLMMTLY